jgi:hypothetical protein
MSITKLIIFVAAIFVISVHEESGLVKTSEWLYRAFAFSNIQSNVQGQNECNNDNIQSAFVLTLGNNSTHNTLWECITNNATHQQK